MKNKIYILGATASYTRFSVYIKAVGERMPLDEFINQEYIRLHKNDTAYNIFNGMETFIALRSSGALKEILQDV